MIRSTLILVALAAALAAALGAGCAAADEADPAPWTLEEPSASTLNPPPQLPPDTRAELRGLARRGPLGLWALQDGAGVLEIVETFQTYQMRAQLAAPLEQAPRVVRVASSAWPLQVAPRWHLDGSALIFELPPTPSAADLEWISLEITR